ncbi:MAG TPA: hypothetical protein VHO50_02045 [Bacteroidales bacterium]|nr:hypothetical protein [Bacteroidales bacterium]
MGEITVREVLTKKDLHNFIYLPEKIHKNEPDWLPPIYTDERLLFNKKKNKSYRYADTLMLLAYDNNEPVGRIMGIINNRYNKIHNENHGRFCFMECYNNPAIFHALISEVEQWAKRNRMEKIIGPLGFSDKDPQGFQIEGFEYPQFMTSPNNSPYMPELILGEGYEKKIDLVNYLGDLPDDLPEIYKKVISRVDKSQEYKIIEFTSKKELKPYILGVLELMNETFSEIYGFVPLNDDEKREFAGRYLPVLDPKFIKLVETPAGELVGFAIGMPDFSKGIIEARGRLFPLGIFKILKDSKRSKKLLMMLGGVKKDHRSKGLDVLMGVKILQSGIKHNMNILDSHLVLENNNRMRAEYERVGLRVVKKFRIYQKNL